LIHRHKLERTRAQVGNESQYLAMNQGITKKRKLWSRADEKGLRELSLRPWDDRRREDLFRMRKMIRDLGADEIVRDGKALPHPISQPCSAPFLHRKRAFGVVPNDREFLAKHLRLSL